MDAISQTTLSSAFSWMKMFEFRLKFHWSLFLRVQLTIFQHWFRWWLGTDQATSHYLNQWWLDYRRIYASLGLNELSTGSYLFMLLVMISMISISYILLVFCFLHYCHLLLYMVTILTWGGWYKMAENLMSSVISCVISWACVEWKVFRFKDSLLKLFSFACS